MSPASTTPTAATAIHDARIGADGRPGTGDDAFLDTLQDLDAVPWVGRGVMLQLLRLAMDAGFFQPTTPCEEALGHAPPLREVAARVALEVAAVLELSPSLSEKADERLSWEDLSVGDA